MIVNHGLQLSIPGSSSIRKKASLPALLFLFLASPLLAGQAAPQKEKEETEKERTQTPVQHYEVIVEDSISYVPSLSTVTTKLPVPIHSSPFSVGVITEPLFESQDARVLSDALRNVSGVSSHSGFGVFDFFVIRGFDSLSSGLVLIDGAPEPESTYYHLYNVDRIEVLKGPGAYLYGGNPLSGSVNLVRKKPRAENTFRADGSLGAFNTFRGNLDFNRAGADGRLAFRLNAFAEDSEFYRDDKDNRQLGINPSLLWTIHESSTLLVDFEYVDNEYRPDVGIPLFNNRIPDVPRTRSYQSPFDISTQEIARLRADWTLAVNDTLTLRNKLYHTDLDWNSDGTLFNGAFPNAAGGVDVFRFLTRLDDHQRFSGDQFEALWSLRSGRVEHRFLAGLEAARFADEFSLDVAFLPPLDLFRPVETATRPLFLLPGQSQAADARSIVLAPYLLDQISFSDRFQLFAGGRLDVIDYDDRLSGTSRNDSRFSPLLGFVFHPQPDLALYMSGSQAFAPPSTQVVGDRKPEESTQYEVGIKKQFQQGKINANLAVYHLERENMAIPDDNGVTRQIGSQRSRGFEVDVTAEWSPGFYTVTSYAFNDAELTEFAERIILSLDPFAAISLDRSGNRPAFAPRHLYNFWIVKHLDNGLSFGGGGRYFSDQFIAEDNRFAIDAAFVADAFVSYRFQNWRWSLNLKNLTDREYETRGFGSTSVLPAAPFALYGKVELGF